MFVQIMEILTKKLALFVISGCGFGLPGDWNEAPASKDGSMSLQEALRLTSEWNFMRTMAPKWVWRLPIKQCAVLLMSSLILGITVIKVSSCRKSVPNDRNIYA